MSTKTARPVTPNSELAALQDRYGLYVSVPTGSKITGTSVRTLRRLIGEGRLPLYAPLGTERCQRVKVSDLVALMERVA